LISVPHLHAELRVQVRERLVEQEHLRVAHDGAAHRDALALAAGELARVALEELGEAQDLGGAADPLLDDVLGRLRELEGERHVLLHGHVRVERVVLEHHRDVPVLGRHVVHHPPADRDLAAVDLLQPGDHPEQRRLPAARGPTSTTNSPSGMSTETPCRIWVEPKNLSTLRTSTDAIPVFPWRSRLARRALRAGPARATSQP
jgi:hypothetical protein